MSILIWLLTFVLILLSVFLVLIVLAQKSKSDGGVGAALGGGMTEATFGAESGNVLATMTRNGTIVFFVLTFALFLAHIAKHKQAKAEGALPTIPVPAAEAAPAVPATAETTPAVETSVSAPAAATAETPAEPVLTVPATSTMTTAPEAAPATTEPAK